MKKKEKKRKRGNEKERERERLYALANQTGVSITRKTEWKIAGERLNAIFLLVVASTWGVLISATFPIVLRAA